MALLLLLCSVPLYSGWSRASSFIVGLPASNLSQIPEEACAAAANSTWLSVQLDLYSVGGIPVLTLRWPASPGDPFSEAILTNQLSAQKSWLILCHTVG